MNRSRTRSVVRTAVVALTTAAAIAVIAPTAHAAVTCTLAGTTLTVTIGEESDSLGLASDPVGIIQVTDNGVGVVCAGGPPTLANTEFIDVDDLSPAGDVEVTISLANDGFEDSGGNEIEIDLAMGAGTDELQVVAHPDGSAVGAGTEGVALHDNEDADVTESGLDRLSFVGSDNGDVFDAGGAFFVFLGGPVPYPVSASMMGGPIDLFIGGSFANFAEGGEGPDSLVGGSGVDTLRGGPGDDILIGGFGGPIGIFTGDELNGGGGLDEASFSDSPSGVDVDLTAGTGEGGTAEDDELISIERLTGSDHDDRLVGNAAPNRLQGGEGNDVLAGRGNADELLDEAGNDTLDYSASPGAVTVNLAQCSATGGDALGDVLLVVSPCQFENVIGSNNQGGDTLTGDARNNVLDGKAGPDTISGGDGFDRLFGRDGKDVLNGAGKDDIIDGGRHDDILNGGNGNDRLTGGLGKDLMKGEAGNDELYARDQEKDTVNGGPNFDSAQTDGRDVKISIEATIA